ncbi:MAG: 50S ribosomal protein L30 [Tissierellia bacterium]|nr:50S ribosomal protein L30 [Tissierellia bacterium]
MLKIKLIKSPIGTPLKHKRTVEALGFKKTGQILEKQDNPQIRGMIKKIDYMIEILD